MAQNGTVNLYVIYSGPDFVKRRILGQTTVDAVAYFLKTMVIGFFNDHVYNRAARLFCLFF